MGRILTLHDLVSHVMDVADLSENSVDLRRAIRSAKWGYQEVQARHSWGVYDDKFTGYFNAAYSTGTVDVSSAGVVTLTGGTWPSWAGLGKVYLGDDRSYRIKSRDSDTEVTLSNWTGETATGETYTLRQDRVVIPANVREVYDVWQERDEWSINIVDPRTFNEYDRPWIYSGSEPYLATFRSVLVDGAVRTELLISPGATTATELKVSYGRRPDDVSVLTTRIANASSGIVTLDNPLPLGGSVVGCVVRYSGEAPPTADEQFGIQNASLATFEGLITAQASTTSFTVPGIPDFDSDAIVISSVLDLREFMYNPAMLYAEANMARIGKGDIREYRTLMLEADEQLRYAMEQDAPYVRRGAVPNIRIDRLEPTQYIVEG